MSRIFLIFVLLSVGFILATSASGVIYVQLSVPELAIKADIIAKGKVVTRDDGQPILIPSKILKGDVHGQLVIGTRSAGRMTAVFPDNTDLMLFLTAPDSSGRAFLLGYGS